MRVLTFGWDFPPRKNGGLGVACFGLTRELVREGVEVIFVLPRSQPVEGPLRFIFADQEKLVSIRNVDVLLQPYRSSNTTVTSIDMVNGKKQIYTRTILEEIHRFARCATAIAQEETYDIIHAHDWTSYLAGVVAKKVSGKPLVLHVHATAYDQAASENVDPEMYKIEKESFDYADKIVTVSNLTRNIVIHKYFIDPEKVVAVHNGCDAHEPQRHVPTLSELKKQGKKIVLYHGRITVQKGVDYFVRAARKVVDMDPDVVFVISGWGDMTNQIINQVGSMGLSRHVIFAGSLWDEDRDRMYQSADLVVMPSVSEPFGLVPLESLQHGTPSVISKQSGLSEVLTHVLKVDFWDVDEMANKIIASLRYPTMHAQLVREGKYQMKNISWGNAAQKINSLYKNLVQYVKPQ